MGYSGRRDFLQQRRWQRESNWARCLARYSTTGKLLAQVKAPIAYNRLARPAPVDDPLRGPAALPPCCCAAWDMLAFAHIPKGPTIPAKGRQTTVNARATITGQINLSSTGKNAAPWRLSP